MQKGASVLRLETAFTAADAIHFREISWSQLPPQKRIRFSALNASLGVWQRVELS